MWKGNVNASSEGGTSNAEQLFEIRSVCSVGRPCLKSPDGDAPLIYGDVSVITGAAKGKDVYCFSAEGFTIYCFSLQSDGTLS